MTSSMTDSIAPMHGRTWLQRISHSETVENVIDGAKVVIPNVLNSSAAAFGSGAFTTVNAAYSVVVGIGSSATADVSMAAAKKVGNYFHGKCCGSDRSKYMPLLDSGDHSSTRRTAVQTDIEPGVPYPTEEDEDEPLLNHVNSSPSSKSASVFKAIGKFAAKNLTTATIVGTGSAVALTALSGGTVAAPAVAYQAMSIGGGYLAGALVDKALFSSKRQQEQTPSLSSRPSKLKHAMTAAGNLTKVAIGTGTSLAVSYGLQHFVAFLSGNSEGNTSCNNGTNSTDNCTNSTGASDYYYGSGSAHPLDVTYP